MNQSALDGDTQLLRRAPMLAACRDGPVSRSTIAERADCSRTTAYRATTELVEHGLLEQADGGYLLTGFGTTALDRIERFRAALDGARRLRPVLDCIDAPVLRSNTHLFTDAVVMEADSEAPYAIEQRLESIIANASERIYGVSTSFGSPITLTRTVDRVESGVDFEWGLPRAVLERLENQHGDLHTRIRTHQNTTVHVVEDPVVDFSLYDDTLVLTGFDEDRGTLAAVAVTDNHDARAWAERLYRRYRRRADTLDSIAF
ncbi:helix-turn-helix domain-containing protein [Haladaptatus sp. DYF46]|uniref:helix-turn-helix transcriptional regulator n=1 Tax=Haladaptatus sp. DYF46 TaxID=2886041 RepID=UPI001E54B021|nr:helix-turn-helix domain-containing protein [Haladaptatus sp. DYF46]